MSTQIDSKPLFTISPLEAMLIGEAVGVTWWETTGNEYLGANITFIDVLRTFLGDSVETAMQAVRIEGDDLPQRLQWEAYSEPCEFGVPWENLSKDSDHTVTVRFGAPKNDDIPKYFAIEVKSSNPSSAKISYWKINFDSEPRTTLDRILRYLLYGDGLELAELDIVLNPSLIIPEIVQNRKLLAATYYAAILQSEMASLDPEAPNRPIYRKELKQFKIKDPEDENEELETNPFSIKNYPKTRDNGRSFISTQLYDLAKNSNVLEYLRTGSCFGQSEYWGRYPRIKFGLKEREGDLSSGRLFPTYPFVAENDITKYLNRIQVEVEQDPVLAKFYAQISSFPSSSIEMLLQCHRLIEQLVENSHENYLQIDKYGLEWLRELKRECEKCISSIVSTARIRIQSELKSLASQYGWDQEEGGFSSERSTYWLKLIDERHFLPDDSEEGYSPSRVQRVHDDMRRFHDYLLGRANQASMEIDNARKPLNETVLEWALDARGRFKGLERRISHSLRYLNSLPNDFDFGNAIREYGDAVEAIVANTVSCKPPQSSHGNRHSRFKIDLAGTLSDLVKEIDDTKKRFGSIGFMLHTLRNQFSHDPDQTFSCSFDEACMFLWGLRSLIALSNKIHPKVIGD